MELDIIILANSVKHSQHCVAGKKWEDKTWRRLVADESGKELRSSQIIYTCAKGDFCAKPLKRLSVGIIKKAPLLHQPENVVISEKKWKKISSIRIDDLEEYLDHPYSLWGTGDYVNCGDIASGKLVIEQSLYLISVEDVEFSVSTYEQRKKRKISFKYNGIRYCLPATDPNFDQYQSQSNVVHKYLCVGLGEEFRGAHYKLVVTIF